MFRMEGPLTQWETVSQLQTAADFADFLDGLDVWIRRPQVINKRLFGASILQEPKDHGSDPLITGGHQDHAGTRQLLRELIPRGNGPSVKELITIGNVAVSLQEQSLMQLSTYSGLTRVRRNQRYMSVHVAGAARTALNSRRRVSDSL